jgi:hypothetical protein
MAESAHEEAALLNLTLANEDHTAEWLRRGYVLGAAYFEKRFASACSPSS